MHCNAQHGSRVAVVAVAAWRQCSAWQCDGGVKLGSTAAAFGLVARRQRGCSAALLGHDRASCHQRCAATARRRGVDEDTSDNNNVRGTRQQQQWRVDEHAKTQAKSPSCVSQVTWGPVTLIPHKDCSNSMDRTKSYNTPESL